MAPDPAACGGAQRRRGRDRRRLHRDVGGLADQGARARGPRRAARGRTSAGAGRAGATAASANAMWFSLAEHARALGRRPALAVARAAEAAVAEIGAFCERAGRRRLVSARRLPAGLDRARPRRRLGGERGRLPRARRRRRGRRRSRPPRWPPAAPRRPSAPESSTPARRPCSPPAWRSACASGCRRGGVEVCESSPVRRCATAPAGSRPDTGGGLVRAGAAVLAVGGGGEGARRARCATGSRSPPPTSSSPSRCRTCSRRSAGPVASASPTAAP